MKQTLLNQIIGQVKQDLININAGETECYLKFKNNDTTCFSLCTMDNYSIIYDSTNDRLIVAWCLKVSASNDTINGAWGNGYYFNTLGGCNDVVDRYDIARVADLFISKALGGIE